VRWGSAGGPRLLLTQTAIEKKAKVMAALALLLPRRKCFCFEFLHWPTRKKKPKNQTPVQTTAELQGEKRAGEACSGRTTDGVQRQDPKSLQALPRVNP
jgi:hypothetical protein